MILCATCNNSSFYIYVSCLDISFGCFWWFIRFSISYYLQCCVLTSLYGGCLFVYISTQNIYSVYSRTNTLCTLYTINTLEIIYLRDCYFGWKILKHLQNKNKLFFYIKESLITYIFTQNMDKTFHSLIDFSNTNIHPCKSLFTLFIRPLYMWIYKYIILKFSVCAFKPRISDRACAQVCAPFEYVLCDWSSRVVLSRLRAHPPIGDRCGVAVGCTSSLLGRTYVRSVRSAVGMLLLAPHCGRSVFVCRYVASRQSHTDRCDHNSTQWSCATERDNHCSSVFAYCSHKHTCVWCACVITINIMRPERERVDVLYVFRKLSYSHYGIVWFLNVYKEWIFRENKLCESSLSWCLCVCRSKESVTHILPNWSEIHTIYLSTVVQRTQTHTYSQTSIRI